METDFKFKRRAVSVEEATSLVLSEIRETVAIPLGIGQAAFYRLAEDFAAPGEYPPFNRSGMDGYAVRSADTLGASSEAPILLEVVDHIMCGSKPSVPLGKGQASRIMTGAMAPPEADAVVMLEQTIEEEAGGKRYIRLKREAAPGMNLTKAGDEIRPNERLLTKGTLLQEGELALLATFGAANVRVRRKPKVAILPTGDELLPVEAPLAEGKIRNSNGVMLAAQVLKAGGVPELLEPAGDDASKLGERLSRAFERCDAVITTGGVSVGDRDVLTDWFAGWDGKLLFNKVMMRPGSPTSAGSKDGKLLFALSGNPGACFVGFLLFVRPALLRMQGVERAKPEETEAFLSRDFTKTNAYERFLRGRLTARSGRLFAEPVGADQSSVMRTISEANCLIRIPPTAGIAADTLVKVIPL
ncbi:gephyrin-like molybdotransferase Glp [Paenibacillus thermotolerans]|uniref:molybdopterin molybdotransferase MoeA n=1 Tax=Paenibacillus thermotolerans TaxID=3027807 RepID=UPI002367E820|nr:MULTISPECIES: gephyrin-like molybdotransferase Glp [unclassified Paenibacillus]